MPHSDDFGLGHNDTELFAAAAEIRASQSTGFEPSPRPTKRRKVVSPVIRGLDGAVEGALDRFQYYEDRSILPNIPSCLRSTDPPVNYAKSPSRSDSDLGSVNKYNHVSDEARIEETAKRPKYRIHIPEHGDKLQDMIFSQTQHGLDDDMSTIRGAVWKKPAPEPHLSKTVVLGSNVSTKGAPKVKVKGIANYFRNDTPANVVDEDAVLAARLQAEENALAHQCQPTRGQYMSKRSMAVQVSQQELATQLADLPDDAFSSSSPEKSPAKDIVELSSQIDGSQTTRPHTQTPREPQTGLRQLDLHGQAAQPGMAASQAAHKRHAWPLTTREEPPTHHKLDERAMKSWIYPTNLGTIRDYQYNIVSRSLFHNTLVALPTGLGKTFIAATVMLNYYRWTTDAKLIFMAPTKPLIAQQMDACYGVVGIPRRDTVLMTGETTPALRSDEWQEKRVFFMTPQTVMNDLKTGIADPKKIVLLIVDEAHKATGGYAYTEVVAFMRRFNPSFRVLALTATPGSTTEAVQAVIDNLGIARVELRTETSLDIRQFTHEKQTETEVFDLSSEQEHIMDMMSKALKPSVDKLNSQNAYWSRDPMQLTAYGLTTARQKWVQSEAGRKAPQPVKGMINAIFTVLSKLAHSISLLKHHGIGPFYQTVQSFHEKVTNGEEKGKTAMGIAQSEHFAKMLSTIKTWANNPEFIGHPKLEYLREVVLNHFLDAGEGRQGSDVPPSATRVMIFASFRDSTDEICRVLKRSEPMIRPHVFVGQAASRGQDGMDQKRQNAVIQDFKSGKFNTLIATSIGEEGLDIGTVDLIVNYDASASPIRMLQRNGRTGRKRLGRVVLLLMRGKEERDYEKAQDNYLHIQKTIADSQRYSYRDDQSPRILPKNAKPDADKRPVEIPVENSQPIDLNEKARKGRGRGRKKAPPKKFHMPDGVRTTFTKASKVGIPSDADDADKDLAMRRANSRSDKRQRTFVRPREVRSLELAPKPLPLPSLADVFLDDAALAELQSRYAQAAYGSDELVLRPPDLERFPNKLRQSFKAKHVCPGRTTLQVETAMIAAHNVNAESCNAFDEALHLSDLENPGPARVRLIAPEIDRPLISMSPPIDPCPDGSLAVQAQDEPTKASNLSPALSEAESEDELPVRPPLLPTKRNPPERPRKSQLQKRAISDASGADEGSESSPEPTPMDMRVGTQGIELGSEDTSGEDEEEQPDSDDQAFIARTSDPLEIVSSSQTLSSSVERPCPIKRRMRRASLASIQEVECSDGDSASSNDGTKEGHEPVARARVRRVINESDDD